MIAGDKHQQLPKSTRRKTLRLHRMSLFKLRLNYTKRMGYTLTLWFASALNPSNSMAGTDQGATQIGTFPLVVNIIWMTILCAAIWEEMRETDKRKQNISLNSGPDSEKTGRGCILERQMPFLDSVLCSLTASHKDCNLWLQNQRKSYVYQNNWCLN